MTIEIATANIERRVADGGRGVWLTAGPGIFTSMYLLRRLGSVDAFIRYTADTILAPSAPMFCEIVGDVMTVESLLDRVTIRPRSESHGWARPVVGPPSERVNGWRTVRESIFRQTAR
jgi:hypothetical protein